MDMEYVYLYNDPIHGDIYLPKVITELINTSEYKRLKNIKQLGAAHYVFPGATHTRYEHGIGVSYLANSFMNILEKNSYSCKIDDFNRICVMIAGLFHDIGHGPFSHIWESFIQSATNNKDFKHEEMSSQIVGLIFNKYKIKLAHNHNKHECGVMLIKALIVGNIDLLRNLLPNNQFFLTEIVNNTFCKIDVDKWDYLKRDKYYLNNTIDFLEFDKAFLNAQVIADRNTNETHIYFNHNDFKCIENIFTNRWKFHIECYQHPVVAGIERLIIDILIKAENAGFTINGLKPSAAHSDIQAYLNMDDGIFELINTSKNPLLSGTQSLLKHFNTGQYYSVVFITKLNLLNDLRLHFNLFEGDDTFLQIKRNIDYGVSNNIHFFNSKNDICNGNIFPSTGCFMSNIILMTKNISPIALTKAKQFCIQRETDYLKRKY